MNDINIIKAVIILYSVIIFLISFVMERSIDDNLFRWISGATSIVVLIYIFFERWIWKWGVFKQISELCGKPIIHGTWKGKLCYEKDATGNSGEIDIFLSIRQTLFTVKIDSFVSTSESYSIIATIGESPSSKKQLIYFYRSAAPYGKRDNNRPHDGSCVLNIIGIRVRELRGCYFTERKGGAGTIILDMHSNELAESFNDAAGLNYKTLTK